jgi:D-lactate dehydrogenase (cytochrome)
MPTHWVVARPAPPAAEPVLVRDSEVIARYLEDAAHVPGGWSIGVVRPSTTAEVAACLRDTSRRILPVGGQSSLTGGATPRGEIVLSTERLTTLEIHGERVRAGAGVPLATLQDALAKHGRWFPPVPTYLGAFVGGAVSTGAAGAATFKYGTVRPWVESLTVVLAGGDVLEIERGQAFASKANAFEIDMRGGVRTVPVPPLPLPEVPKRSAGYHLTPDMDLVDLFIGSEGTLGIITDVTLRTAPLPAAACRALVSAPDESAAIALVDDLRRASRTTWTSRDPRGIDISAIEYLDARSVALLREDGVDRRLNITLPGGNGVVLIVELELPEDAGGDLWAQLAAARDPGTPDTPLVRFCRMLDRHGTLDDAELALPMNRGRAAQFGDLREAVPTAVNHRVARARDTIDAKIHKMAADVIVQFPHVEEMLTRCRKLFAARELDLVVWGHISDGNVHPNVIPARPGDVERAEAALLALGIDVIELGGCPLAEHGVGRSALKQRLVQLLYGDPGIEAMRRVKRALDPSGMLAPGVLFPAS